MIQPTFTIESMTEPGAREMLSWRYEPPYDFYNASAESLEEDVAEALDGSQYTVRDVRGQMVGFLAFGENAQVPGGHRAGAYGGEGVVDVGLGMRPDLTGKGLGLPFMQAAISFARDAFHARSLRLSVATFNQRAITVYERAGFVAGPRFESDTPAGIAEFLVMTCDLTSGE